MKTGTRKSGALKGGAWLGGLSLAATLTMATLPATAGEEAAHRCKPSDIGGDWLMLTNNDYAPAVCTLVINNKGVVTTGTCTTGKDNATLIGELAVATGCTVTGKFKLKTANGTFFREVSLGIMAPDHSYFTMVAFERGGKELATSFVQRIP